MNNKSLGEKTEDPTPHRIEEEKKKGNLCYSQDFNSFLVLVFGFFMLRFFFTYIYDFFINIFKYSFYFNSYYLYQTFYNSSLIIEQIKYFFVFLFFFFLGILILIISTPIILYRQKIFFRNIFFNIKIFNFVHFFKKLFSINIGFKFLILVFKIFSVFFILKVYFLNRFFFFNNFFYFSINKITSFLFFEFSFFLKILMSIFFIFSIIDIFWKKFKYFKNMRMNIKEIQDESKELEGNPLIKKKMNRNIIEMYQKNNLDKFKKLNVIIYSEKYFIGLHFNYKTMIAPIILFKKSGRIFSRLIKMAKKNNIPIYFSYDLSKSLFFSGEENDYIPYHLYDIVSEVFSRFWK